MLFNSFHFIFVFLPISVGIYWLLRQRGLIAGSNLVLLGASFWFYYSSEPNYRYLILASIAANYVFGLAIDKANRHARRLLAGGVAFDLLVLAYFKYGNFILQNLRELPLPLPLPLPNWPAIVLPVGISFFTFTQIAYLVDCYKYKSVEFDLARYGLFVTFFPHLIAGPILHHSEMMPQFRSTSAGPMGERFASAFMMFALGLFKKVVIADSLGQAASQLFSAATAGAAVTFVPAWAAALCYGMQIYFDFSGYSDMAIGISRAFGIALPINFNSPYKAMSIADFWRRWHISLSRFLRDYLYVPLGGNRGGTVRTYFNLFVTMVLGGLWHGASWNFIVWGGVHGIWLAVERLARGVVGTRLRVPAVVARLFVFLGVMAAWVPFRAPDLPATVAIWKGMSGLSGVVLPLEWPGMPALAKTFGLQLGYVDLHPVDLIVLALALGIVTLAPNSQEMLRRFDMGLDSPGYSAKGEAPASFLVGFNVRWALGFGLLFGIALAYVGGYSEFIYFQF